MEKTINTRILNKIDTQANWDTLTDFVPKKGELIIYSPDENYDYSRIKIGDGTTTIVNLPFCNIGYNSNAMIGPITIQPEEWVLTGETYTYTYNNPVITSNMVVADVTFLEETYLNYSNIITWNTGNSTLTLSIGEKPGKLIASFILV